MSGVCGWPRLAKLANVIGAFGNLRGFLENSKNDDSPSDPRRVDPFAFHAAFLDVPSEIVDASATRDSFPSGFVQKKKEPEQGEETTKQKSKQEPEETDTKQKSKVSGASGCQPGDGDNCWWSWWWWNVGHQADSAGVASGADTASGDIASGASGSGAAGIADIASSGAPDIASGDIASGDIASGADIGNAVDCGDGNILDGLAGACP